MAKFQVLRENIYIHVCVCVCIYIHTHTHILACIYTNTYIYLGCRSVNHNFFEQYILANIECGQFRYIQVITYSWKVRANLAPRRDHYTCGTDADPGLCSSSAGAAGRVRGAQRVSVLQSQSWLSAFMPPPRAPLPPAA